MITAIESKLGAVFALVVLVSMAVACCAQSPAPQPPPEPNGDDAGSPRWSCVTACVRLADLGCEVGKPSPSGKSCQDVCQNAQTPDAPPAAHWKVQCLTKAQSCDQAEACR